ncbi:hypothetical protein EKO27_g9360 [Xylaria grammica]|uniref:Rhodopsin domain-containing protein n=1 Tax=Xylaria grammica TaxID=363999 RepID=A0A439CUA0_9PEZI|nr:hypothetical protein EKO27_g9360 [Xylaria grammica]
MQSLENDLSIRDVGSNGPMDERPSPLGLPYEVFIGFNWAGVAVATFFLAGRLYSRFCRAGRVCIEDFCISFAYILVVITASLWQYTARDLYYTLNANAGTVPVGPDFVVRLQRWLVIACVVEIFFYTTLILFKLSMLFFFKRLGNSVDYFNYLWWPILFFSLVVYFVGLGDVSYQCYLGDLNTITVYCNSRKATMFLTVTLDVNAALDVLSDFLIMLIPITLLWNVRIRWQKKIAIMGIFSLSLITIGVAIARVADIGATQKVNGLPDSSYLWFWTSLQMALSIVVSCSSAFRQLFTVSAEPKNKPAWSPTASYYERLRSGFRSRGKKHNDITLYDIPTITEVGKDVGYTMTSGDFEQVQRHDSDTIMLVPGEPERITACYTAPGAARVSGNQISDEQEYHVTRHAI